MNFSPSLKKVECHLIMQVFKKTKGDCRAWTSTASPLQLQGNNARFFAFPNLTAL
jgi:hypothetical protein